MFLYGLFITFYVWPIIANFYVVVYHYSLHRMRDGGAAQRGFCERMGGFRRIAETFPQMGERQRV